MGIRTGTAGIDPSSEIPGPGQNWFLSGAAAWKTGQGEAEPGTMKDAGAKTVVALTVAEPLDHLDDTLPESL